MLLLKCTIINSGFKNAEEYHLSCIYINKAFIKYFQIFKYSNEYEIICTTKDGSTYYVDGYHFDCIDECERAITGLEND